VFRFNGNTLDRVCKTYYYYVTELDCSACISLIFVLKMSPASWIPAWSSWERRARTRAGQQASGTALPGTPWTPDQDLVLQGYTYVWHCYTKKQIKCAHVNFCYIDKPGLGISVYILGKRVENTTNAARTERDATWLLTHCCGVCVSVRLYG